MKREEIAVEARRFVELGTPFRKRGRNEQGLDCAGLPAMIAKKFKIPYEEYSGDIMRPDTKEVLRLLRKNMLPGKQTELKPGMLVLLHNMHEAIHLGILAEKYGRLTVIHMAANYRRCVEEYFEDNLKKHFSRCFEFPGVED